MSSTVLYYYQWDDLEQSLQAPKDHILSFKMIYSSDQVPHWREET